MRHHRATALAAATLALVLAPAAGAHVTVQPTVLPAGGHAVVDVRVPNERADRGTTKVRLRLPPGVSSAAYQRVPNWRTAVTRRRPVRPFSVDGEPVREEVDTIVWTGTGENGVVAPGQFLEFPVALRVPDGAPGTTLTFEAFQTYEDGEVVRWTGAGSPAPSLTLGQAGDGPRAGGHGVAAASGTAAPPASDDGSDALPIALGVAGLVAGLAGLGLAVSGRRRG